MDRSMTCWLRGLPRTDDRRIPWAFQTRHPRLGGTEGRAVAECAIYPSPRRVSTGPHHTPSDTRAPR